MGHPWLHKTEEERLNAARRYRAKYYARNKKVIGLKMAMKYCQKKDNNRSNLAPEQLAAPKCDINDAQSKLVMICAKLEPLSHRMVHDFQDHREGVQKCLSQLLETLEHVQEYLHFQTFNADSDSSHIAMVAELWCYSAMGEIDEEMTSKYHHRADEKQPKYQSMAPQQQKKQSAKQQKKPLWQVQDEFLQMLSPAYFRIHNDNDRIVFFHNLFAHFFA
ncbi:hypothetical protein BDR06DRAFT_974045 [Suillus hirtellus]|nr:hypothetical protein BDR06DRAFT_974045 [Suillus hirtellus]